MLSAGVDTHHDSRLDSNLIPEIRPACLFVTDQ